MRADNLLYIEEMKVILIRHAIAEEQEEFAKTGEPDANRPLSNAGRKKMKRTARGLSSLVDQIDLVATSPLLRAVETAEILVREFANTGTTVIGALEPSQSYETFMEWLQRLDDVEVVAAIGHEPHLSGLAAFLLTGREQPFFEFKKAGTCLIEFEHAVEPGAGRLRWLLTPAQLRELDH